MSFPAGIPPDSLCVIAANPERQYIYNENSPYFRLCQIKPEVSSRRGFPKQKSISAVLRMRRITNEIFPYQAPVQPEINMRPEKTKSRGALSRGHTV